MLAQSAEAEGIVSFGEAFTLIVEHEGTVIKSGRRVAERAKEKELTKGGANQIRATHDFGDPHGDFIYDAGQLITRDIILPPHHKIAEVMANPSGLFSGRSILES